MYKYVNESNIIIKCNENIKCNVAVSINIK